MNKRLTAVCAAFAVATIVAAQVPTTDKWGSWTGVSLSKKLDRRWSLNAELELRTQNAMKNMDRWTAEVGTDYRLGKHIELGLSYSYLYSYKMAEWKAKYDGTDLEGYNVTHAYWLPKHRLSADITGEKKLGRWTFSLRERLQFTHSAGTSAAKDRMRYYGATDSLYNKNLYDRSLEYNDTVNDISAKNKLYLRSRVMAEYNIPDSPITPYVSYELYNDMKHGMDFVKGRIAAGMEWKINKHNSIDAGYRYVNSHDDDDTDANIISITYKLKF
jgi:hypothetical protein